MIDLTLCGSAGIAGSLSWPFCRPGRAAGNSDGVAGTRIAVKGRDGVMGILRSSATERSASGEMAGFLSSMKIGKKLYAGFAIVMLLLAPSGPRSRQGKTIRHASSGR